MCGILGVRRSWLLDRGLPPEPAVAAALDALAWRGPDGSGSLTAGDWLIGCARLAITDGRSTQPLRRRLSGLVGVLNGAIVSARDAWQRQRPGLGGRRRLPNDAWLPLLWVEGGQPEAMVQAAGHHAAVVLDGAQDVLWLFRDAMGEKPLFVVRSGAAVVAFASTAAALRRLGIQLELPDPEVARFFRFGFAGGPAATDPALAVDWDLRFGLRCDGASETIDSEPDGVAGLGLRQRIQAAVARHADVEVPLGLCLSGGLDSSILALALHTTGHRVPCYQFRAAGEPDDERRRARDTADAAGHDLRPVDGGPEVLDALWSLSRNWGLPLGDPSVLAVHAVAQRAAADGVRVLLGGEGADELWFGYRRHTAARWLARRIPLLDRTAPLWSTTLCSRLLRAAASAEPYEELLAVTPPGFRTAVLAPQFAMGRLPVPPAGTGLQRAAFLDQCYLRWDLLPKVDVATMAAGVEGRSPFLDPVARGASAAPVAGSLGKRALRAAFAADLPPSVRRGGKRGFALPLDRWLRGDCWIHDLLADRRTLERSHLLCDGVRKAVDRHRQGRARIGHGLYLLAAMEVHLRGVEEAACASPGS